MMGANYKTKKDLKAAVGQSLRYEETSFFGPRAQREWDILRRWSQPDPAQVVRIRNDGEWTNQESIVR